MKLNKSVTETCDNLTEDYGDASLSRNRWHKAFKEAQENVEDNSHSERSISSTGDHSVEIVRAVIEYHDDFRRNGLG